MTTGNSITSHRHLNSVLGFTNGIRYPLKAIFFIIKSPSLWPMCLIPLIINVVVLWFSWVWLWDFFESLIANYTSAEGWWNTSLRYILYAIAFVLRIIAIFIVFITVGSLAALPFNDFLSERTDKLANRWIDPNPFRIGVFIRNLAVTLFQEMKRITIYLLIMLPLFLLSFIPILSPFIIALKLIVTAMFFATDYLSYPLERRGLLMFRDKMQFARKYSHISIGFGIGVTCLALIPFVNFLLFPLAVVGGTLMFGDIERHEQECRNRLSLK